MNEKDFGKWLKKLRKEKGWSQETLANKLHVSRQAVYKWETNRGYPDINNLIEISKLFNVTVDELVKEHPKVKDRKNQSKNEQIEEDLSLFDKYTDPGFALGSILIFIGFFVGSRTVSSVLVGTGIVLMLFANDLIHYTAVFVRKFKQAFKG